MGKWLDLKGVSVSRTGLEFFGHPLNTFSNTGAKLKAAGGGGGGGNQEPSSVSLRKRRGPSSRRRYDDDDEDEDDEEEVNEKDNEDEPEEEDEEDEDLSQYRAQTARAAPRTSSHAFSNPSFFSHQPWEDEAKGRYQPIRVRWAGDRCCACDSDVDYDHDQASVISHRIYLTLINPS